MMGGQLNGSNGYQGFLLQELEASHLSKDSLD